MVKKNLTKAELRLKAQETGRPAYPPKAEEDWTGDQYGAMLLASRLAEYWHDRGYDRVQCWLVKSDHWTKRPIWGVRSNIVEQVLLK